MVSPLWVTVPVALVGRVSGIAPVQRSLVGVTSGAESDLPGRSRLSASCESVHRGCQFVRAARAPPRQARRSSRREHQRASYEQAGHTHYAVGAVLRWLLYHVAELDLYLGVIPFAALIVLVVLSPRLPRKSQAFVAAAVALSVWLLVEVAAFASKNPVPPRVEERNMFYLAPLFLIALLVWIDSGMPRRHVSVGVAAVVAAALPGVLPYSTLIGVPAASDELALSIWWRLQDQTIAPSHVATWAVVASILAALMFLLVPRRLAVLLPAAVAASFVAVTWTAMDNVHGFRRAAVGALFQGITDPHRDWVDRAVGHDANVAVLWTTSFSRGACAASTSSTTRCRAACPSSPWRSTSRAVSSRLKARRSASRTSSSTHRSSRSAGSSPPTAARGSSSGASRDRSDSARSCRDCTRTRGRDRGSPTSGAAAPEARCMSCCKATRRCSQCRPWSRCGCSDVWCEPSR